MIRIDGDADVAAEALEAEEIAAAAREPTIPGRWRRWRTRAIGRAVRRRPLRDAPRRCRAGAPAAAAPATKLLAIEVEKTAEGAMLHLRANGSLPSAETFALSGPSRLVIDLPGLESAVAKNTIEVGSPLVARVRVGHHDKLVRVVVDAGDAANAFEGRRVVPTARRPGGGARPGRRSRPGRLGRDVRAGSAMLAAERAGGGRRRSLPSRRRSDRDGRCRRRGRCERARHHLRRRVRRPGRARPHRRARRAPDRLRRLRARSRDAGALVRAGGDRPGSGRAHHARGRRTGLARDGLRAAGDQDLRGAGGGEARRGPQARDHAPRGPAGRRLPALGRGGGFAADPRARAPPPAATEVGSLPLELQRPPPPTWRPRRETLPHVPAPAAAGGPGRARPRRPRSSRRPRSRCSRRAA